MSESRSLNDWMNETVEIIKRNGFDEQPLPTLVALLHSECSELLEAWRKGRLYEPSDHAQAMRTAGCPVMTCADEEVADIIIRALWTAHCLGVDPERAVRDKCTFNATRPHRHGDKVV